MKVKLQDVGVCLGGLLILGAFALVILTSPAFVVPVRELTPNAPAVITNVSVAEAAQTAR